MKWDEDRIKSAGMDCRLDGNIGYITTPGDMDVVTVWVIEGEMQLMPRRSSGHARVIAALGADG